MALSIVSGIIIHRHIFRDLMLMRWGRSLRVALSDLHKVLGVWAVLFHLTIALTGAWLGLEGYLVSAAGSAARGSEGTPIYSLQQDALAPEAGPYSNWSSIAAMVRSAEQRVTGFKASNIELPGSADPGTVIVRGDLDSSLIQRSAAHVAFDARSGGILQIHDPRESHWIERVHATLEPLHYGYFGGFWVKLLYFLLGLTPAILGLSGALIYADRTARKTRARSRTPGLEEQIA